MFYIDRTDDLNVALGNTLEHLNGYFYIQELAASSSPYYMSGGKENTATYTILDMSASPGGKTTQLSEYYPNSTIIANEIDKTRLKWLFSNIDRMWAENICVTNYDGRFFKQIPELFDKVLLDAPCSAEGTAFKTDDALKFWNIKNTRRIAKLQFGLLEAAGKTIKVGWEIVYSTCTLNTIENEKVLEKFLKKYEWIFEVIPLSPLCLTRGSSKSVWINTQEIDSSLHSKWHYHEAVLSHLQCQSPYIRNRPHRNKTGGFFVAKLRKVQSLLPLWGGSEQSSQQSFNNTKHVDSPPKGSEWWKHRETKHVRQNYEKLSSKDNKVIQSFYKNTFSVNIYHKRLYTYRWNIYLSNINIHDIWETLFFYQIGKTIGALENSNFIPNFYGSIPLSGEQWIICISKKDYPYLVYRERSPYSQTWWILRDILWKCLWRSSENKRVKYEKSTQYWKNERITLSLLFPKNYTIPPFIRNLYAI